MAPETATVDPEEVARFSRLAQEWWDPKGKFKPLHRFNPVRLAYLQRVLTAHFGRDAKNTRSLEGLSILDIGCGGGLIAEPLARLGARVTGVDPSATNITVARLHAAQSDLVIDYQAATAEDLAAAGATFDVVLALEVVEHVADVPAFLDLTARMVRPGGIMVVATINRTLKAFGLAIIGAEYLLGWLPRGTHRFEKLVRPGEITVPLQNAGLEIRETVGVVYDPFRDLWKESQDTDVNYMVLAARSSL